MTSNKIELFLKDFSVKEKFEKKIYSLYSSEYEDLMELILIKSDNDFHKELSSNIHTLLEDEYTPDIFQNKYLNIMLRRIDKSFFESTVQKDKCYFLKKLKEVSAKSLNCCFTKHCNYQESKICHNCEHYLNNNNENNDNNNEEENNNDNNNVENEENNNDDNNVNNEENNNNNNNDDDDKYISDKFIIFPNKNKQLIIICNQCQCVYTSSCVKAYCTFCSIDYYTNIDISNEGDINNDVQPATWEKYHCNIIYNDQMPCVSCKKEKLFYDIIQNVVFCKKCKFVSEPRNILWKCVVCKKEFISNAKIYNPLEFKMIKKFIKETLMKKELAFPKNFHCKCNINNNTNNNDNYLTHKEGCDGILYIGKLRDKDMVICSKCKTITFYDKFIWYCHKCGKRFRDNDYYNDKEFNQLYEESIQNANINHNNNSNNSNYHYSDKSLTYKTKRRRDEENRNSFNRSTSDTDGKNNSYNINRSFSSNDSTNINNNNAINNNNNNNNELMELNLSKYDIISQIGEGSHFKIFACKESDSFTFYALKKKVYKNIPEDYINLLKIQNAFSSQCQNITSVYGLNYNNKNKELIILEELAMSDLDKEILSVKRSKTFYKQSEILELLYQICTACSYLESQGYVHWNINPSNILIFKDKNYKLNNFSKIKQINNNEPFDINYYRKSDKFFTDPFLDAVKSDNKKKFNACKFDVFCLGLCIFYTATMDIQNVIDVHSFWEKKYNVAECNEKLANFVHKSLCSVYNNKDSNSVGKFDILEDIILKMLNSNLKKRFSFDDVIKYLNDIDNVDD